MFREHGCIRESARAANCSRGRFLAPDGAGAVLAPKHLCGVLTLCVRGGGGWRHIIEEGLYGSAGSLEGWAVVLQRMPLLVPALAPSVYATLT